MLNSRGPDSSGFAVPVRKQKKLIAIKPAETLGDVLHICWMLHNQCNKRCSYCRDFNWNGSYRWLKYEHVVDFLERVFQHYRKDLYHISFTGGEPTLWPDFARLVTFLRDRGCEVGLTTNATRRVDYWQGLSEKLNWVCLSYHPESAADEQFIEVTKHLMNRNRLAIRLMMHKEEKYWNRSIAFGERLKTVEGCRHMFVEYVPLQDDFGLKSRPTEYAPWQQEFFSKQTHFVVSTAPDLETHYRPEMWQYYCHYSDGSVEFCHANDLVAHNQVNFRGWECHIGRDLLFINHMGEIFRGNCMQGGKVGHVFDRALKFPEGPLRCGVDFCPCGTDILVRKSRA